MKAKRPARGTGSAKKPPARGGRTSGRDATRMAEAPPSRRRAQARERRPRQAVPQAGPIRRRRTESPARPKSSSQAKARSKARKAKAPKVVRTPLRQRILVRLAAIELDPRMLIARVPFVVLIIAALGTGLGVTLWLSTDAAERSYQLGNARQVNQALMQQKEALERDVLEAQAAPALAEAARELGMIPSRDTAHLVQDATGNWVVVGTPKPAEGAPPPPLNAPLPDPAPPAPAAPRVVEPLEVPVRIPSVGEQVDAPGQVPGLPAVPLTATPGVDVPHAAAGPAPMPGPGPLVVPGAPGTGVAPPEIPLDVGPPLLLPEPANQPAAPMGAAPQPEPVPGAPA